MFVLVAFSKMPKTKDHLGLPIGATFKMLFKNKRYSQGVIAQAFYVGAQIMVWTFIFQYVDNINASRPGNELTATWYNMTAMSLFLCSRAMSTYLLKYVKPGKLMLIFSIGAIVMTLGAIFIVGLGGLYSLVGISIFMSLMFPTIYGIALKDMGEEAKLGSAGLVMAIVGGALMPPLQGRILDLGGPGFGDLKILGYIPEVNASFVLPLICFVVIASYSYRSHKYYLKED
jgi:FHS family L-fucose permease-like MFS transporter